MTSRIIVAIVAVFAVLSLAAPVDAEAGQRSMLRDAEGGQPCDVGLGLGDVVVDYDEREIIVNWDLDFRLVNPYPARNVGTDPSGTDDRYNYDSWWDFDASTDPWTRYWWSSTEEYQAFQDFKYGDLHGEIRYTSSLVLRYKHRGDDEWNEAELPPYEHVIDIHDVLHYPFGDDDEKIEIEDALLHGDVRCVGPWVRYLRQ